MNIQIYSNIRIFWKNGHRAVIEVSMDLSWWVHKFWIFKYLNLFKYSNFLKNGHRAVIGVSMDFSWWVHKLWIFWIFEYLNFLKNGHRAVIGVRFWNRIFMNCYFYSTNMGINGKGLTSTLILNIRIFKLFEYSNFWKKMS